MREAKDFDLIKEMAVAPPPNAKITLFLWKLSHGCVRFDLIGESKESACDIL